MRYRRLGHSGLFVSELCLGTMTFGGNEGIWGQIGQLQQDEADSLVRTALDAGINFFDTANIYNKGLTEEIVGRWLPSRRDAIRDRAWAFAREHSPARLVETLVQRTLDEHARLRALNDSLSNPDRALMESFATLLHDHVRFEERELFETAQALLYQEH